jgi:hypothetical protein
MDAVDCIHGASGQGHRHPEEDRGQGGQLSSFWSRVAMLAAVVIVLARSSRCCSRSVGAARRLIYLPFPADVHRPPPCSTVRASDARTADGLELGAWFRRAR